MKMTGVSIVAMVAAFGTAALAGDGKEGIEIRNDILNTYSSSQYLQNGRYSTGRILDTKVPNEKKSSPIQQRSR